MKADGTSRRKISSLRIFDVVAVSPDGRWVVASAPCQSEDLTAAVTAFAVDGGAPFPLCVSQCRLTWNTTGTLLSVNAFTRRNTRRNLYRIPLPD